MAQNGPFGTPFLTRNPAENVYVGPLRSFPGSEAQLGALEWRPNIYVERVYLFFSVPQRHVVNATSQNALNTGKLYMQKFQHANAKKDWRLEFEGVDTTRTA